MLRTIKLINDEDNHLKTKKNNECQEELLIMLKTSKLMSVKSAENYFVKPNLRSHGGRYGMKMLLN